MVGACSLLAVQFHLASFFGQTCDCSETAGAPQEPINMLDLA